MIGHYHGGCYFEPTMIVVDGNDILATKVGNWQYLGLGELVWTFYAGF